MEMEEEGRGWLLEGNRGGDSSVGGEGLPSVGTTVGGGGGFSA